MTTLLLLAPLALLTAGAGFAQTADGQTPAEEDVCDLESGAAFGLCNAYCEAMDCHLNRRDDPGAEPPFPKASETACNRVFDNFMKLTGRVPPCELAPCPVGTEGCPCDEGDTCEFGLICDTEEDPPICVEDSGA